MFDATYFEMLLNMNKRIIIIILKMLYKKLGKKKKKLNIARLLLLSKWKFIKFCSISFNSQI